MKISWNIVGLMSGTSLDALDISYTTFLFNENANTWSYNLVSSKSIEIPIELKGSIKNFDKLTLSSLLVLDKNFGRFLAESVNDFIQNNRLPITEIDAIASHGQTLLHQPQNGFTYQIGCGETISTLTGIQTINDFRTKDVVLGGQGAPLVPIGDAELFGDAESFLNLGGFSNISFKKDQNVLAYDICPTNLILNRLANKIGFDYDKSGLEAKKGVVSSGLLQELNQLEYYIQKAPKSLGTEWIIENIDPIFQKHEALNTNDQLRTFVEHIAIQIAAQLNKYNLKTVFCTGGGVFNDFLMSRINHFFNGKTIIPAKEIIEFKESIIFGFLGALYLQGAENILNSVTGSSRNSTGGVLHIP